MPLCFHSFLCNLAVLLEACPVDGTPSSDNLWQHFVSALRAGCNVSLMIFANAPRAEDALVHQLDLVVAHVILLSPLSRCGLV